MFENLKTGKNHQLVYESLKTLPLDQQVLLVSILQLLRQRHSKDNEPFQGVLPQVKKRILNKIDEDLDLDAIYSQYIRISLRRSLNILYVGTCLYADSFV